MFYLMMSRWLIWFFPALVTMLPQHMKWLGVIGA